MSKLVGMKEGLLFNSRGLEMTAEDGIRDRSPSRGLGDVYKRQVDEAFQILIAACFQNCFGLSKDVCNSFLAQGLSLIHI